jgi:hypothetical protein
MSFLGALGSAILGGVTGNIANKAAIQNQQNAENNALNITNQNTARAQGQLSSFWAQNPFNRLSAPTGAAPVTGAGAPTMGIGGNGLMQALMLASGQPQGGAAPQTGGMPNAQAAMPNMQAGMPSFGQQGQPQQGGQRRMMQGGQAPFALPQAPQAQAQQPNIQAILSQMYGVR